MFMRMHAVIPGIADRIRKGSNGSNEDQTDILHCIALPGAGESTIRYVAPSLVIPVTHTYVVTSRQCDGAPPKVSHLATAQLKAASCNEL
jgi:hypothetical protein